MAPFRPQEVHGTMAEHGQSLCPCVCANPAGIFMKGHLENPMVRMRHALVLPYGLGENRPPCAGSEVRNYRVAICPFSPTARHDSTLPILCHLAPEVLAPSE